MVKSKVVSDKKSKEKCKEWLEKNGFTDIKHAKNLSCDLVGRKSDRTYYIEIKYSSKEEGNFFGTVMLTEFNMAIHNKENYLFLVCRGKGEDINDWLFYLFDVENFMKCCSLTTPIFLYHLEVKNRFNLIPPKFSKNTVMASEKLIEQMWKDFTTWKSKLHLAQKENK